MTSSVRATPAAATPESGCGAVGLPGLRSARLIVCPLNLCQESLPDTLVRQSNQAELWVDAFFLGLKRGAGHRLVDPTTQLISGLPAVGERRAERGLLPHQVEGDPDFAEAVD